MQELPFENGNQELVFFRVYGLVHRWTKKSFYSYTSIPRASHGLMVILCDGIKVEYPDGSVSFFENGDVIYMPKGIYYHVRFLGENEPLEALMINFSISGEVTPCYEIKCLVKNADAILKDPFYKIASFYLHAQNHRYEIMEQFYRLLNELKSRMYVESTDSAAIKSVMPALEYINSHLNEPMYVPTLAKLCLLSESAFRKRFRESYGKTPGEYISDQRLKKASELLKSTDIPIPTIASRLGFYDSAYFYKLFKKKYQVTPSEFRFIRYGKQK